MKSALIYFSNTGKTKEIADQIKKAFDPDEFVIEIDKPYGGFISSVGRYVGEHIRKKVPRLNWNRKILEITIWFFWDRLSGQGQ